MHPQSIADKRCPGCGNSMIYITNVGWICNTPDCPKKAQGQ